MPHLVAPPPPYRDQLPLLSAGWRQPVCGARSLSFGNWRRVVWDGIWTGKSLDGSERRADWDWYLVGAGVGGTERWVDGNGNLGGEWMEMRCGVLLS